MVKHLLLIVAMFVLHGTSEKCSAHSLLIETVGNPPDEVVCEKPKPGSKRWLRQQRHVRNTRRKKYPRMRRGGQADWTVFSATQAKTLSEQELFEQNGTLVVEWGEVKPEIPA